MQTQLRFPLKLLATALATTTFVPLVQAEEQFGTMVVTASRADEDSSKLPLSLSSVDETQLELDQGAHIQDSTRMMAGVTINQLSGSSSHNAGIRMPMNYSGYYLFLQDSIPLQSSAFFNHNGLRWASYNSNVKQIEVLKGAGSTLYGSGAVAATVNVISADPEFAPKGDISLHTGEDDYAQLRFSHTDKIAEDQAILISGSALQDKGWREHSARDRQELMLKHLWLLDEDTELKTQFQASSHNDEMATSLTEEQYYSDPTQSGLSRDVQAINPERDSDFIRLNFELTKRINDQLEISLIPYYRYNTNDYIATWRSYTPRSESSVDSFGLLAKGNWAHENGNETLFGIDLERSEAKSRSFQPLTVSVSSWRGGTTIYPQGFIYQDHDVVYKNASPYLQHNMILSEQLTVQAGLRYDYNHYSFDNHLAETDNDGFGNRQLADREDSFNSLSPKLGFHYALNAHSGIYGRLAQANRLPTASALYNLKSGDSSTLVGGVEEESSTTAELGYRLNVDNLSFSAAIYHMEIDDAIVNALDDNGDTYKTNAGETLHEGIELELRYQFSNEWSTQIALSHSRHKFEEYLNSGVDYSGNEMMRAPRNKVVAALNWSPSQLPGLDTQLQLDHFGDYWKDDANTEKASSHTLYNLKAQYQISPELRLFARVDNLFDKKYAYQSEISWGRNKYYPGPERRLFAGLKYSW